MAAIEIGGVDFIRNRAKILGNVCSACINRRVPDTEFLLQIDMGIHTCTLCSVHEGLLLEKLLTNYLKRKRRGSQNGFLDGIKRQGIFPIINKIVHD